MAGNTLDDFRIGEKVRVKRGLTVGFSDYVGHITDIGVGEAFLEVELFLLKNNFLFYPNELESAEQPEIIVKEIDWI